jgi:hypothetical protein
MQETVNDNVHGCSLLRISYYLITLELAPASRPAELGANGSESQTEVCSYIRQSQKNMSFVIYQLSFFIWPPQVFCLFDPMADRKIENPLTLYVVGIAIVNLQAVWETCVRGAVNVLYVFGWLQAIGLFFLG